MTSSTMQAKKAQLARARTDTAGCQSGSTRVLGDGGPRLGTVPCAVEPRAYALRL
ncbi:MAG: hypothetical protein F2842_05165 [Actinobacteria bacterium]|nr:hypothetical protein [Actinomycetota bacterium]